MVDFLTIPGVLPLLGTLSGFALGTLTTSVTLRSQYKLKAMELASQSRLKGKELLFAAYQNKIQTINARTKEIGEGVGRLIPLVELVKTDDEKRQMAEMLLKLFKETLLLQKQWFAELEQERKDVGLDGTNAEQVAIVKEALENPPDYTLDPQLLMMNWAKTIAIMDSLRQDVLTKRCEDLFRSEIETLPAPAASKPSSEIAAKS